MAQPKRLLEMLTTYMNHQLTRLDVATTEGGYLLTINQVIEFKEPKTENVEAFIKQHEFKPIIMEKIEWSTPAQPAVRADYFSSLIGPEVNTDKVAELIDKMQNRELSLISRFRRTANRLVRSTPNSSPCRVGGQIRGTLWIGMKGAGFTEPSRN